MKNKLNIFEAISIIIIITVAQIILDFPEYLVDLTGSGTIVNILFLAIISLIFCIIISKIFKNFSNHDIIDISEIVGGNFLKFIISIIFIVFLFITVVSAILNFLYLIRNVYFPNSNSLFILSIFMVAILFTCLKGFYPLKKSSSLFIGIFILSIICLFFGDNGNFNSNNLIPIFGFSYKTTFGLGFSNIFIFNFILIYFFLMPLISKKNDYKKILFSSYPAPITHSLSKINTMSTILLVTRRIQISSFLSQTDSIFVFIWSFAILNYISFLINGIIYILNKLFKYENKERLSLPVISIILGCVIFVSRIITVEFLENIIFKYYSIILTFGISFIILVIGYFKNKMKGSKNEKITK